MDRRPSAVLRCRRCRPRPGDQRWPDVPDEDIVCAEQQRGICLEKRSMLYKRPCGIVADNGVFAAILSGVTTKAKDGQRRLSLLPILYFLRS